MSLMALKVKTMSSESIFRFKIGKNADDQRCLKMQCSALEQVDRAVLEGSLGK